MYIIIQCTNTIKKNYFQNTELNKLFLTLNSVVIGVTAIFFLINQTTFISIIFIETSQYLLNALIRF